DRGARFFPALSQMKTETSSRARAARLLRVAAARLPAAWRDPRARLRVQVGLAVALAVGLLVYAVLYFGALAPLNPAFTDLLYQPVPPSGMVAIIAIDKKSLDELGPWPWPRAVHAALLDRLAASPPRVIAFDVLFSQP